MKKMKLDDGDEFSASTRHLVFAYYVTGHGFGHATRVVEVCFAFDLIGVGGVVLVQCSLFVLHLISSEQVGFAFDLIVELVVQYLVLNELDLRTWLGSRAFLFFTVINCCAQALLAEKRLNSMSFVSDHVTRHLIAAGHDVHVVTGAPDFVFTSEIQSSKLFIRKVLLDCGAVQTDALTVDRLASLEKYSQTAVAPRASILATEVEWLNSIKADLVISDVVPVACRAAADAGIRSVCVTNFSWDFIYAEYVMAAGYHHRSIVWQIAEDYSHCEFLIRLPGYCPMPAFRDVFDVPLVVRRELGIGEDVKLVIFNFGGQPAGWNLKKEFLPDGWLCVVAARIIQGTAVGKNYASDKFSGARRLRDAIVLGYQLQRAPGRDADIPEWYSMAETELGFHNALPNTETNGQSTYAKSSVKEFDILHGDLHGLSDTISFLKSLSKLANEYDSEKNSEKRKMRERIAAAGLFNWEDEIVVTRAPGRLDVMGGIADYSGSLVLQLPIREACHVAVQRTNPSRQKLWKHAQARQIAEGQRPTPVLQIVSYGSELSNRGPTFDMDLTDLMDGEKPMSYEKARKYFAQDPSQKWAAYVAGTLLVLMTELGVRFDDGISMLVSSAVPEGKGVSSSAAVEVASMSAIAAAYGVYHYSDVVSLRFLPVENHIVGAPCGVMDQMTSACGEANKLLAMVCQPAEIIGLVTIPTHIRFWGIDSGIRHSVGGADYGSVRVGTFMGRKMVKLIASSSTSENTLQQDGMNSDELEEDGVELLKAEASLDYLCNLPPHRFEAVYAKRIPKSILGEKFLKQYTHHDDSVTVIDKKHNYAVRASARHPIYENARVKACKALLTADASGEQLSAIGELMYQVFPLANYSACGLGSDGTDRLVKLVQEMQHKKLSQSENGTLFGAKITGGGSGGTVCVVGRNCVRSSQQILEIQQIYKAATGFSPFIFEGSSPGAGKFGHLRIRYRQQN
ncbi:hypothetical protein Sjap_023073 [Stephania japonica]|uniref:L-arabinokinase n=1 Tax=Stephania japonica TaxID=461633 RepID=A0AAP0HV00_9MAGN